MNRQELVKAIADESGHSQSTVGEVLNSLISTVQNVVAGGDKVSLVGFGTFESTKQAERQGRNCQEQRYLIKRTAQMIIDQFG